MEKDLRTKKYFQIKYYLGQRNYSVAWWYAEDDTKRPIPYFIGTGKTPATWKTEAGARRWMLKRFPEAIEIIK